ncbi:MAG: hypothetical protein ACI4V5_07280 [Prevotella sp.]
MNKTLLSLLLVAVTFALISCGGKNQKPEIEAEQDDCEPVDTTVYGRCGAGTAMHTLELVTDKGDTIVYHIYDEDSVSVVYGGLFVGDRLAVIQSPSEEDMPCASKIINLTSLMGRWASIDRHFELREGGVVISDNVEPKPYTEWKILNGQLVLSADTFDIYALGPDSLYIENSRGIYGYKRQISD